MQNGRNVDIDFRVGNMICKNKKTEFNFLHRIESKGQNSNKYGDNTATSKLGDISLVAINQDNIIKSRDGLSTATSTLSHIPNTSRRIKLEHVPKPPPKGTKRRIGDTGQKMPAGGRLLKNPSDATLVGMKFERPKQIQGKDGIEPNDKYPPLMDAFTHTIGRHRGYNLLTESC